MYEFLYNQLKPVYKDNVKVLYTDTDSFLLKFSGYEVYNEMLKPPLWHVIDIEVILIGIRHGMMILLLGSLVT